jgi:prepilin-type N-terminal cleavage/methylation domain-containing protein
MSATAEVRTMNRDMHRRWRTRAGRAFRQLRAFTLLEVMVSVAALAVLAVGIAAVFDVTGRTVTGGRRISAVNAYANLLQQQMQADIEAMTRDGFLVIRNQVPDTNANGVADVPTTATPSPGIVDNVWLHAEDTAPRPRRVDELMFFIKGQFASARDPMHPELVASSDSARVYYGHGERAMPILGNSYARPEVTDTNAHVNGRARLGTSISPDNPNRYASDWTLLRHVTLLVPRADPVELRPSQTSLPPLSGPAHGIAADDYRWLDSEIQIAGQPAASSIFRALAVQFPINRTTTITNPNGTFINPTGFAIRGTNPPQFSSGLIDIATNSLTDIRAIVMTADTWPGGPPAGFPGTGAGPNFFDPLANNQPDGNNAGLDRKYRRHGTGGNSDQFLIQRSQAWMSDAFPTLSDSASNAHSARRRIRYEPVPPNIVGAANVSNWGSPLEAAYRRADQAMLASWGFVPHCTEFIVEWSYGNTFPSDPTLSTYIPSRAGELIWHGLERMPDPTNLVLSDANLPLAWPRGNTTGPAAYRGYWAETIAAPSLLIHGVDTANGGTFNPAGPLMSYFGYIDPRHNGTREEPTRPWPWPAFIRITLSLADPRDPSEEQTFQFVFAVPQQES